MGAFWEHSLPTERRFHLGLSQSLLAALIYAGGFLVWSVRAPIFEPTERQSIDPDQRRVRLEGLRHPDKKGRYRRYIQTVDKMLNAENLAQISLSCDTVLVRCYYLVSIRFCNREMGVCATPVSRAMAWHVLPFASRSKATLR